MQLCLPAWGIVKTKLQLSALPQTSCVVLGQPAGCQQRSLWSHQLQAQLPELGSWTRSLPEVPSNFNCSVTSEQPVVKGRCLWENRVQWSTVSQKGRCLCLLGRTGSSTQAVGFKVHFWATDLLGKYRQWNAAVFISISYVWRKSPYFSGIEHDTVSSFWPSLAAGFDAAYEVDKKDRVIFFKGISLTFSSVLFMNIKL